MAFEFEFQYSIAERERCDKLNRMRVLGPAQFALLWCLCFVPTLLCLCWLQMWTVMTTLLIFVVIASFVPLLVKLRSKPPQEQRRTIKFGPVGIMYAIGSARFFQKWNTIDEIIETESEFLFARYSRYSILPKRVIEEEQLDQLRQQIGLWRDRPENPHLPIELYRNLLDTDQPIWEITLDREELVAFSKSRIRIVNESSFSFRDIELSRHNSPWRTRLPVTTMLVFAVLLIIASLPPNRLDWASVAIFICLNPLGLLFGMAFWIRRQGISSIPRVHRETYRMRLLDGGWAIGNEELANFNAWTDQTVFYLTSAHVGIRSEFGTIHVLPASDLGGADGRWQFLDQAIKLKKAWLARRNSPKTDSVPAATVDNNQPQSTDADPNPYRAPRVS